MKITQDVREYARAQGVGEDQALQQGLQDKAVEFKQQGSEIYKEL
jgi:phosphomethylpyrimidine synthase